MNLMNLVYKPEEDPTKIDQTRTYPEEYRQYMFMGHWNQFGPHAVAYDDNIMFDLTYEEVTKLVEKEKAKKEEKMRKDI